MMRFLQISNGILFVYYLLSNLIYFLLLGTAIFNNTWHRYRLASLRLERLKASPFTPPITLLVPAHNEEKFIVESIESLLQLDYPDLEIIVINDDSRDQTLSELKRAYHLEPARLLYSPEIVTAA